ncbi:radical SAM family heme chaperone HemW [Gangjinia marincola]|uniref:radical SAM family heme chaperone HemW n=1 Tax=Gangjinia marincola TaxID=578463 RepID=UPI0031D1A79E
MYLHIPFCKQACHYCDFHFSTSVRKKGELVNALCVELELRKKEAQGAIETIYFGGGTPSLLSHAELNQIFETITQHYTLAQKPEITLEANPDDLTAEKLQDLSQTPINRLSIGVQSFFEEDLRVMNRAHSSAEAKKSIELAREYFDNISIDLIYGMPNMSTERWGANIAQALALGVPHISAYALTVEPNTALKKMIEKQLVSPVDDDAAREHFDILVDTLTREGFDHYEFSNFGKPGYYSQNNLAYWMGKTYVGIGPSAHGFDGKHRYWNVKNNTKYIKAIAQNELPHDVETLTKTDQYNEYVMTRLRTQYGISLQEVKEKYGKTYYNYLLKQAEPLIEDHLLFRDEDIIKVSTRGKFLSDGIASDLFLINLS